MFFYHYKFYQFKNAIITETNSFIFKNVGETNKEFLNNGDD